MKLEVRKQFINNLKGIKNRELADEIEHLMELIDTVSDVEQITGIKKLTGYHDYYRIRVEDYRVGVKASGNTIVFVCMYHRSVIYKQFP